LSPGRGRRSVVASGRLFPAPAHLSVSGGLWLLVLTLLEAPQGEEPVGRVLFARERRKVAGDGDDQSFECPIALVLRHHIFSRVFYLRPASDAASPAAKAATSIALAELPGEGDIFWRAREREY